MHYFFMVLSCIFSLLILNLVMIVFMRHSYNIKLSKSLLLIGSCFYLISVLFSNKLLFAVGQSTMFIGIAFGIYGLYKYRISNFPVILFSSTFIIIEILAYIFNLKFLMFSIRFSGSSLSTIASLVIPFIVGFLSNYIIHKKYK